MSVEKNILNRINRIGTLVEQLLAVGQGRTDK